MIARRIDAHTVTLSISNAGGAILSFLLTMLIGRALGEDGLGAYTVALAWTFPLSLLVDFGLSTLLTRDTAGDPTVMVDTLRQTALERVVVGGVVSFSLICFAPTLSADLTVQRGIVLAAPMVILLPFFSTFSAVFRARGDMRPVLWLNVGMLLAQVALTAGVFTRGGGVLEALAVNTLTSAGQLAAAWAIWRRRYRLPSATVGRARQSILALLRAGLPFALAGVFAALNLRLTLILLEALMDPQAAGVFTAASRFTEAAKLLPNAMFGALFPALSALAASPDDFERVFARNRRRLLVYGAVVACGLLVFGAPLVGMVYGDGFTAAVPPLIVLGVGLIPALLRGGQTLLLFARRRETVVNWINALALLIQGTAALLLIPSAGVVGGALALLFADLAAWAMLVRLARPSAYGLRT
ncbi:MAG: oligosaccharide flippase family protein [Anaerolineae bacterium]|nr:oligosaccharide flippase family protein [Anaerolineae bacterium]NUQ03435.1 oligosaccharide flippase family protein [Anaerolineae bacterium]